MDTVNAVVAVLLSLITYFEGEEYYFRANNVSNDTTNIMRTFIMIVTATLMGTVTVRYLINFNI